MQNNRVYDELNSVKSNTYYIVKELAVVLGLSAIKL